MINPHTRYRTHGGVIFRHPIWMSANPPPIFMGKSPCDDPPHDKSKSGRPKRLGVSRQISSSSAGGRWDRMVLTQKSETGIPHTAVFQDVWKGWDRTIRTNSQVFSRNSTLHFEKDYSSRSLIGLPPPT